jgi:hypothetical protein
MTETSTPAAAGYRATFATVTRILAMATGTLTVIQFALAGYGTFSAFKHHRGFGPHEIVGTIIGVATLLVLITALVAHLNWRIMGWAIGLFLMAGPIQPVLAGIGKHHAWVGALHALVGIGILAGCFLLSMKVRTPAAAVPVSAPEPV